MADTHMQAGFDKWQKAGQGRTYQTLADEAGVSRSFMHQCVTGTRLWPEARLDDLPEPVRSGAVRDYLAKAEADVARFKSMLKK